MRTETLAVLVLLSAGMALPPPAGAQQVELKDLVLAEAASIPAGCTQLAVLTDKNKPILYVAQGENILFLEPGKTPMTFATLPDPVRVLRAVNTAMHKGLFALTQKGNGRMLTVTGTVTPLFGDAPVRFTDAAFTVLPLFGASPHAIGFERGQQRVYRLAPAEGAKAPVNPPLAVQARLEPFPAQLAWFGFCEIPGNWSLLGLTEAGEFLRIDAGGVIQPWLRSSRLKGARCFVADSTGLFGAGLVVSVPQAGEIWAVSARGELTRLVRGLEMPGDAAAGQGVLGLSDDGTLYILAGPRILSLGPAADGPLAQGLLLRREAEALYAAGDWKAAHTRVSEALKKIKNPRSLVAALNELRLACEGASALERAEEAAARGGHAPLLKTALSLEKSYGATRMGEALGVFRKRCEIEGRIVILEDFEDTPVRGKGIDAPTVTVGGARAVRAALPDPVQEGRYSLKWDIPARRAEVPTLRFEGGPWASSDLLMNSSVWVYSERDRYHVVVSFLNVNNVELGRYPVVLSRGWQQITKSPLQIHREFRPGDLALCAIVFEAASAEANQLYLDDLRLLDARRR